MKTHVVERKIMWGDLDSLGIVFYPRYYEWIDACGHLFFEAMGIHMGDLWRERNLAFGLAGTSCRYFRPGRYHDRIRITTAIDALEEKTVLLKHAIRLAADENMLVEGFEERICLDVSDPDRFRAVRIPEDIYTVLKEAAT
jgi:YbgC/YbaW family acyl-CoA thioester hydrolase